MRPTNPPLASILMLLTAAILVLTALARLPAQRAAGADDMEKPPLEATHIVPVFGDLDMPPPSEADRAREAKIEELLAVVRNDRMIEINRKEFCEAMVLLGQMRALEAAPAIVERLEVGVTRSGRVTAIEASPEVRYPAIRALKLMGEPAMSVIADAVAAQPRSDLFKLNAFSALYLLAGGRPAVDDYLKARHELYQRGAERLLEDLPVRE